MNTRRDTLYLINNLQPIELRQTSDLLINKQNRKESTNHLVAINPLESTESQTNPTFDTTRRGSPVPVAHSSARPGLNKSSQLLLNILLKGTLFPIESRYYQGTPNQPYQILQSTLKYRVRYCVYTTLTG